MSAQHTPGPWVVSHDDDAGHYDITANDLSEAIAMVFYTDNKAGGRGLADARLIAAAPELLEARETLFDAIQHGDEEHRAWLKEAIDVHFAAADAKAKGETA